MRTIFIEIFIYLTWATVFFTRSRRAAASATEELQVLLFALPTAIILEIKNEFLPAGSGVYYPSSLLYFPDFKFPLAIAFSSSLFTWALFVASRKISLWIAGEDSRFHVLLQLGLFLVLLSSYVVPEALGPWIGYWKFHITPPESVAVWVAKYAFYFLFTFPPVLIATFFSWRRKLVAKVVSASE
jgi:hypothetical protein